MITALGGRRAAFRLLFAASFVPYFLPEQFQPAFFKDEKPAASPFSSEAEAGDAGKPKVDSADAYTATPSYAFSRLLTPSHAFSRLHRWTLRMRTRPGHSTRSLQTSSSQRQSEPTRDVDERQGRKVVVIRRL